MAYERLNDEERFAYELAKIVGDQNVIRDQERIGQYEQATFKTDQRIRLVVLPASVEEIQAIVCVANTFNVPLYPISRGRNWGLGSRVPVQSGNCVLDLQRMNRILEFSEEQAYITVEPGVTFHQVAEFLREKGSALGFAAIGGPPDASMLANALERGDGVGPLGDRARSCCALEAILPNGERLQTGLAAFSGSLTGHLSPFGLGPAVEGLFFQSNLAIVTRMTFWLARRPPYFQCVVFAANSEEDLIAANAEIRKLHQLAILGDTAYSLWNVFRFLSAQITFPWQENPPPSPEQLIERLPATWQGVRWVGFLGIYAPSFWISQAQKRIIKRALKGKVNKLLIIDSITARLINQFKKPLSKLTSIDVGKMIDAIYFKSIFLGQPTKLEVSSIYWRKRGSPPKVADPDQDRCGLHWICPSLPFDGKHILRVTEIVENVALANGLEPMCMFFNMNQWYLKSFIVIMFDQAVPEEEIAAKKCHDEILLQLNREGYSPVRLGIQSMHMAPDDAVYVRVVQRLKQMLDPNDILAPGHYDFRTHWKPDDAGIQAQDLRTTSPH